MRATFKKSALKALRTMQPAKAMDIREAIAKIAADPMIRSNNITPLKGMDRGFRLRVGDWRVSYTLDHKGGILDVFEIKPRGGAYR